MTAFQKVFKTKSPFIGVIHFMPLLGYPDFEGMGKILDKALKDLNALEKGGVDAVFVENNYDYPHKIVVNPETVACMSVLTRELVRKSKVPVGVSVLWNDYRAALAIAKASGAKFIRIPVFVDKVKTNYGFVEGDAKDVVKQRKIICAEDVILLTDIHVKHAEILTGNTIAQAASLAVKKGSDALIVTGRWTGEAPDMSDLESVRKAVGNFPIFVGSGADGGNINLLKKFADGAIVSTSLKTTKTKDKVNVLGYHERIDEKKVKLFAKAFRQNGK